LAVFKTAALNRSATTPEAECSSHALRYTSPQPHTQTEAGQVGGYWIAGHVRYAAAVRHVHLGKPHILSWARKVDKTRGPSYSLRMRHPLLRRFNALLLAVAFVTGGFGLADADALLFHSGRQSQPADAPHFDPPGGCGGHAEHCALAVATSLRQLGSVAGIVDRFAAVLCRDQVLAPAPALRSPAPTNLQPARAPPAAAS
jgi:hypothetical protein